MLDLCSDGWRQGSIVDHDLALRLLGHAQAAIELGDDDLVVVISHDCDICQPDLGKEPFVELLPCHVLARRPQGDRTLMKNPRLLEFEVSVDNVPRVVYALAAERWSAPRDRLGGVRPSGYLSTRPVDLLPSWISRRYIRVAFPTSFDRRWKPAERAITRALSTYGEYLNALFVTMTDDELPEEADYRVALRGTMLRPDFDVPEHRRDAQHCLGAIASALDGCDGITVVADDLVSEADVSLDDARVMKRWDPLDIASFAEETEVSARVRPPAG